MEKSRLFPFHGPIQPSNNVLILVDYHISPNRGGSCYNRCRSSRLGGGVFNPRMQGTESGKEAKLPINFLKLRVVRLSLPHWAFLWECHPIWVQSNHATPGSYINQRDTRSLSPLQRRKQDSLVHRNFLSSAVVHMSKVDNWQVDYGSC